MSEFKKTFLSIMAIGFILIFSGCKSVDPNLPLLLDFLGNSSEIYFEPDSISAERVTASPEGLKTLQDVGSITRTQESRLLDIISEVNSYTNLTLIVEAMGTEDEPAQVYKFCSFQPGVRFRFWRDDQYRDLIICLICSEWRFHTTVDSDTNYAMDYFGSAYSELAYLIIDIFPHDQALRLVIEKELGEIPETIQ